MKTFCGQLPEGVSVCAEKPVLLLNWPDADEIKQFDTKSELLRFLASHRQALIIRDDIRVYEFADDQWNEVAVGISHAEENLQDREIGKTNWEK